MKNVQKLLICYFLCSNFLIVAQNSIIILYGCSSAGKTSISAELLRILPGNWKYIASNQFRMFNGNNLLWKEINQQVANGYDVIVDTHDFNFFIDAREQKHVVVCLVYCSPVKLVEHVQSRNAETNQKNHRPLKAVLQEYVDKFKSVSQGQPHIDRLYKHTLKNHPGFFVRMALKSIIARFFVNSEKAVVYIAPKMQNYDCLINTGKLSVEQSAAKIQKELLKRWQH